MLDKWDKHKDTEKLKNRVFKGIPAKLRGKAWLKLMDVESEAKTKEGKYQVCIFAISPLYFLYSSDGLKILYSYYHFKFLKI